MPENKLMYNVVLPDGRAYQFNPQEFNERRDSIYNSEKGVKVYSSTPFSADMQTADNARFAVTASNGKTYDFSKDEFNERYDAIMQSDPKANISVLSPDNYWEEKATKQKEDIDAFDEEYGAWMNDYRKKSDIASMVESEGGSYEGQSYLDENKSLYDTRIQQRKQMNDEYMSNPFVQDGLKAQEKMYKGLAKDASDKYEEYSKQSKETAEYRPTIMGGAQNASRESVNFSEAAALEKKTSNLYGIEVKGVRNDDETKAASYLSNYFEATGNELADLDNWSAGLTAIDRNLTVRNIVKDLEGKGLNLLTMTEEDIDKNLSKGQSALLSAFVRNVQANADRANDMADGYSAGQTFAQSIPFMVEFIATGGLANAAGEAISKNATSGLAKWIGRELTRGGSMKAISSTAGKAAYAGLARPIENAIIHTVLQPSTFKSITDELVKIEDDGSFKKASDAIWGGLFDSLIENWSESMGEGVGEIAGLKLFKPGETKVLGQAGVKDFARWITETPVFQLSKQAGYDGLVSEMGEEWLGNLARIALNKMSGGKYGMTVDEFKDFASLDQQLDMAASFAPMAIFGAGSSAHAIAKNAQDYAEQAEIMKGIFQKRTGKTDEEISDLFDGRHSREYINEQLKPVMADIISDARNDYAKAYDDYKNLVRFSQIAELEDILEEVRNIEHDKASQEMRSSISASIGGEGIFYTKDADGNESVTLATDAEGNTSFVVGEAGDTVQLVTEGSERPTFISKADFDANYTKSPMSMKDFIDARVQEKERLDEEKYAQQMRTGIKDTLVKQFASNPMLNLGTKEAPKMGQVLQVTSDGVIVGFDTPTEVDGITRPIHKVSFERAGNALGLNTNIKTKNQRIADDVEKQRNDANMLRRFNNSLRGETIGIDGVDYRIDGFFSAPVTNENGELVIETTANVDGRNVKLTIPVAQLEDIISANSEKSAIEEENAISEEGQTRIEGATPKDFRGNDLPMDENGQVDSVALWNNDPEAWCYWNDSRRGGNSSNSKERLVDAVSKNTANRDALIKQRSENPDAWDTLSDRIDESNSEINKYANILAKYEAIDKYNADVQNYTAQLSAVDTAYLNATNQANADALAEQRHQLLKEYRAYTTGDSYKVAAADKTIEFQKWFDENADLPVTVITLDNYEERMLADGCSSAQIAVVRSKVDAIEMSNITGYKYNRINGLHVNGRIYIFADTVNDLDSAKTTYRHERQHEWNTKAPENVEAVVNALGSSISTARDIVKNIARTTFYDGVQNIRELADEIIAYGLEDAEIENSNYEDRLRKAGANEDVINTIKEIYGREYGNNLPQGAGNGNVDDSREVNRGQDGRDTSGEPGSLEREGLLSVRGGEEETQPAVGAEDPNYNEDAKALVEEVDSVMLKAPEKASSEEMRFSYGAEDRLRNLSAKYFKNKAEGLSFDADMLDVANAAVQTMVDIFKAHENDEFDGVRVLPPDVIVPKQNTIFKNGSYGRTMENTTKCLRTLAYNDFVDAVKENLGRPLTTGESFLASQMLYDIAVDPQCLYCYVSLDRKAYDEFLLRYLQQRDAVIEQYNASGIDRKERLKPQTAAKKDRKGTLGDSPLEQLYSAYLDGREDSPDQRDRFNMWLDNADDLISPDVLITEESRAKAVAQGGSVAKQVKDAHKYAQSASWAKVNADYRAYNGEILKMGQGVVDMLKSEYGLRFYSFSEYSPAFIVENMQMMRDAALRGLNGLAYTKETDFARIYAPTGVNINVSCFGRKAEDGTIVMDTKQGADWEEAKALREQYGNVGAVFVATDDEQAEWALDQDWIDVIIPFHIVRTGAETADFYGWINHTAMQADVDTRGHHKDIMPTEHHNDKNTFLSLCAERGLKGRFADMKLSNGKSVITHPNYMKLVNETRRSIDETVPLSPAFDLEAAKESFAAFVEKGGYYGGWWAVDKEGVKEAVKQVADDIRAGKNANEVDYGRQNIPFNTEALMKQARKVRANKQHGNTPLHTDGLRFSVGEKDVENVIVDSKDINLPTNRDEAIKAVEAMVKPFINADQSKEIIVSKSAIKHTATQDSQHNRVDVRCIGVVDRIIKNAVKIGNEDAAEDEKETTNAVEVYYCPVKIDDIQYSVRMLVKQYKNRGAVMEDFRMYDMAAKQKKSDALSHGTGTESLTPMLASDSFYKVKELIHNSQEKDKKLIGIEDEKTLFSVTPEQDTEYLSAVESGDMEKAQQMVDEAAERAGYDIKAYHGSRSKFNTFDPKNADSQFGNYKFGNFNVSYFTSDKSAAESYTGVGTEKNLYSVYLKLDNPYEVENITEAEHKNSFNIKDATLRQHELKRLKEFEERWIDELVTEDDIKKLKTNLFPFNMDVVMDGDYLNIVKRGNNSMFGSDRPITFVELGEFFESDAIEDIHNSVMGEDENDYFYSTDHVVRLVLDMDQDMEDDFYDGVVIKDIFDSASMFAGMSTDYVVFGSYNIKSADPVTYDDNGKAIPLSERFNEENPDIRFSVAYHGTSADFDEFTDGHELEGEGAMVHGYGVYVAMDKGIAEGRYATRLTLDKMRKQNDPRMIELSDDFRLLSNYRYEQNQAKERLAKYKRMDKTNRALGILPSNEDGYFTKQAQNDVNEFQKQIDYYKGRLDRGFGNLRQLYTLEIPDDNGSNYLTEGKTIEKKNRRKIADVVRKKDESELMRGSHGSNWMPNGLQSVANGIENNTVDAKEMRERLMDAFGTEKKASKIMSEAGFVGIKYHGRIDGDCAVIFDPKDIKITEHTRFSVSPEEEENASVRSSAIPRTQEVLDEMEVIEGQARVNGTWMKAPNGKPTKLTEDQWKMVRTKNFIDWFGDWMNDPENASKMVDENGEPMVVYHGSSEEFSEFKPNKWNTEKDGQTLIAGYFSNSKDYSENGYGEAKPFFISAKNTLNLSGEHTIKEWKQILAKAGVSNVILDSGITGRDNHPVDDALGAMYTEKGDLYYGAMEIIDGAVNRYWEGDGNISHAIAEAGYDSISYPEGDEGEITYAPLDPNQIKSATDNNGNFNPESNDVRFRVSEENASFGGKNANSMAAYEEWKDNQVRFQAVYHGSAADFEQFDHKFMSTGEGGQAYGWGTYVTEVEGVALSYAKRSADTAASEGRLEASPMDYVRAVINKRMEDRGIDFGTAKKEILEEYDDPIFGVDSRYTKEDVEAMTKEMFESGEYGPRHLYTVEIPDDDGENYLHWNKPLTKAQSKKICDALIGMEDLQETYGDELEREVKSSLGYGTKGSQVEGALNYFLGNEYDYATGIDRGAERNAKFLRGLGFVGMQVPVNNTSNASATDSNYVIFEEGNAKIADHVRFSVFTAQDAAYMDAVNNGDMETAEKMVREAFKNAFPNTKVVDENGAPLVVYHGSPATFDEFRKDTLGMNTDVESSRMGFFFTPNKALADWFKDTAEIKGQGYDIFKENILDFTRRNATKEGIDNFLSLMNEDGFYDEESGEVVNLGIDRVIEILSERMDGYYSSMDELRKDLNVLGVHPEKTYKVYLNIENPVIDEEFRDYAKGQVETRMTDVLNEAKKNGNDGVIFTDINEVGGRSAQYVSFEPNQIKSAEAVTYDREGNVIPLSQRFNSKSNDIRFSVSNSYSSENAVARSYALTDIHEQVANEGLKAVVGDESDFLMGIYDKAPEALRRSIISRGDYNIGRSIEKAIVDAIENDEQSEILDAAIDNLREAMGEDIPTNDAKWMLYRGLSRGTDPLSTSSRYIVADRLGFDKKSMEMKKRVADDMRFSVAADWHNKSAADMYNNATSYWVNRLKEGYVDMYESVADLVRSIEIATGKPAESFEDVRLALNQQSSKGLAAMSKYTTEYLEPMWGAIKNLMEEGEVAYEDVVRYVMLKHAVERNEIFAKRDAKAFYKAEYDKVVDPLKQEKRDLEKKKRKAVADGDISAALTYDQRLADIDAQILDEDKKLSRHNNMVDNGTAAKYKENRELDYGGLTSMFSSYPGLLSRSEYKTDEEYELEARKLRTPQYSNVADMEDAANAEAEKFEKKFAKEDIKRLWDRINAATKKTLLEQYKSNLLSREQYESARDQFEYYVPLRGFKDATAEDLWSYYNASHSGSYSPALLGAKGRTSEAEDPFIWIGTMASSGIASDVKNEAKLALYYFISNRPNQDLMTVQEVWYKYDPQATADYRAVNPGSKKRIFTPSYPPLTSSLDTDAAKEAYDLWEEDMKKAAENHDAYRRSNKLNLDSGIAFIDNSQAPQHVVKVKVRGKDMCLFLNGSPRAAQAINGLLNLETAGDYQKILGPMLRWMSSVNTSYNPEFWISNLQRDLAFAFMSMNIKGDGADNLIKNLVSPKKMMSMMKAYEDGTLGNSKTEEYYKEFAENGAITGYTVVNGNDYWEKEIEDFLKPSGITKLKHAKFLQFWQNLGEAIEQMTRFSAYVTAREAGKDVIASVNDAKEISVNFNRKGSGKSISFDELGKLTHKDGTRLNKSEQIGVYLLSLVPAYGRRAIMFFNAAIQGLNAMYKLWKKDGKKLGGWMAGYFTAGVLNAVIHSLTDDDDDYLDMPEFTRRNNLLLGGGGIYFKWAMPQEARMFYAMGDIAVNHIMGRTPNKNALGEAFESLTDVLPISLSGGIKAALPSVVQPFVDLADNKDFTGSRIYNDLKYMSEDEREMTPRYSAALKNTSGIYIEASKILNSLSFGNSWDAGYVNIPPEAIQHVVESLGGGTLTTLGKFWDSTGGLAFGGEWSAKRTPFLNRVLVLNGEQTRNPYVSDLFYYYKSEAEHAKTKMKRMMNEGDEEALNKFYNSKDFAVLNVYEKYKKQMKAFDESIKSAEDNAEKRELMKEQDDLRKQMIKDIKEY